MLEVSRREKEAGIIPDPDIDTYMKVGTFSFSNLLFFLVYVVLYILTEVMDYESKISRNHEYFHVKSTGFIVKMAHVITFFIFFW